MCGVASTVWATSSECDSPTHPLYTTGRAALQVNVFSSVAGNNNSEGHAQNAKKNASRLTAVDQPAATYLQYLAIYTIQVGREWIIDLQTNIFVLPNLWTKREVLVICISRGQLLGFFSWLLDNGQVWSFMCNLNPSSTIRLSLAAMKVWGLQTQDVCKIGLHNTIKLEGCFSVPNVWTSSLEYSQVATWSASVDLSAEATLFQSLRCPEEYYNVHPEVDFVGVVCYARISAIQLWNSENSVSPLEQCEACGPTLPNPGASQLIIVKSWYFPTCQVRVVRFYVSWLPPPAASCRLMPPPAAFRLLRTSTARIHAKCSLPDLNRENPRQVFPAGPQPRPSTPSVPCRTSTATIHTQCSLPDLNRENPRQVFPAGPHPPERMPKDMPDRMPDRTSDRVPDRMSEDMPDRMSEDMPDRMSEDMTDRMSADMPDRMSEDTPDRMSEDMPDRMSDRMPDRMSEDMPDRMSEDMPDGMPDRYARRYAR